ncbi:uncharacterized protein N7473_007734 [Penicillium subrubescens]|uniref:uncharacterized protein n=1 Tax=Penicillium subrubescens TaxID=1316194 RepID=UPI0025457678|nr:uncharacterized protein N7473_007734 [Penicillium subrubescens]KAJ5891506.1 hypothetical protein N7473_007734 [Penicillium subrubescens]
MAFPFFPESHRALSLENYIYMRQRCERRRAVHKHEQKDAEHIEQITSSSSAERSSFEQASLQLQRSGSGSGSQGDRHPSRLARILIPARLRRTRSLENRNGPNDNDCHSDHVLCISPTSTATRLATSTGVSPSTRTTTPTTDPAKHIFRLYSARLTNPFSPHFELNPLLLNITQPLLSKHHSRRRNLRVLDLGGIEGTSFMLLLTPKTTGVYTQTLATLPHVAICQLPQQQLPTKFPPYLPFKSKSFDVITTRTLYKFLANTNRSRNPEPRSWVREIHRILDKGGHFEFFSLTVNSVMPDRLQEKWSPVSTRITNSAAAGKFMRRAPAHQQLQPQRL